MTIGLTTVVRRWALIGALAFAGIAGLSLCGGARAQASQTSEEERLEHAGKIEGGAIGSGLPAHHETPEIHGKSLALQLLNFAVLIFVLVKFGGPAISKALAARHEQLKADLAAASAARAEAEARLAKQEARLSALEQEIEAMRTGVKAEAEAEKARLIALAEERAKRIREETTFVLDQQVKEAEERLRREVALAAVDLAEQMVKKSLGVADQQRMVDTFVADVAAPGKSPAPRGQA